MNLPPRAQQTIRTSLVLGAPLHGQELAAFLIAYYEHLRQLAHDPPDFPAFSPGMVLNLLMLRHDPICAQSVAGSRAQALRDFARERYRLQLSIAMSDFGPLEQRASPYNPDRATYLMGREIASASVVLDYPSHSPYRTLRRLHIPLVRQHFAQVLELMPDYLWWSFQDQHDAVRNVLAPEKLHEVRRQIERAGFDVASFGLYLSTFETVALS